jgi:hypothetical protein
MLSLIATVFAYVVTTMVICGGFGLLLFILGIGVRRTADRFPRRKRGAPRLSRVRLDPLHGNYELRAYAEPVDVDADFDDMTENFELVGLVRTIGRLAYVSMVCGKTIRGAALKDFKDELRRRGVTKIEWERRNHGKHRDIAMRLHRD